MTHVKKIPSGEGCVIKVDGVPVLNPAGFPREFTWDEAARFKPAESKKSIAPVTPAEEPSNG